MGPVPVRDIRAKIIGRVGSDMFTDLIGINYVPGDLVIAKNYQRHPRRRGDHECQLRREEE